MSKTLNLVGQLLAMSRTMLRQGRREEARSNLQRLANFRELPAHIAEATQAHLGQLALRRRSFSRARRHFTALLLYRPQSARYHYWMALALASGTKAQPESAAEHFRKSLECEPQQPRCLATYGLFCLRNEQTNEGLDLLRRAAELSPDDVGILTRVTRGLGKAGCWDEALGLARAARFRNPRDARFTTLWNDLLFRQLHGTQARRPSVALTDEGPVVLPFRRPAPNAASAALPYIRRDAASKLPAPHVLPRPSRRADWKHG
jgi:tetratricopeptide (TPR) repeat protein